MSRPSVMAVTDRLARESGPFKKGAHRRVWVDFPRLDYGGRRPREAVQLREVTDRLESESGLSRYGHDR